MELDLNELERLAEAATQGPWIACGPSFGAALPKYLNEVVVDIPDSEEDGIEICQPPTGLDKESSRDMEFIGAANPAVVLELVRRLREAEARVAELEAERVEREKQEPIFWYRPLCHGGMYEGPLHHNSPEAEVRREEEPGEWVPLIAKPIQPAKNEG